MGKSKRDAAAVVLDFLRTNAQAIGVAKSDVETLRLVGRTRSPEGGRVLTWSQEVAGVPAAGATLRAVVDAEGRLRALSGDLVPALDIDTITPVVSAADAYRRIRGGAPAVARGERGPQRATSFRDGGQATLTVFRRGGSDRLGWRVLASINSRRFEDAIVDATTGRVERRLNRVRNAGQIAHFDRHPGAAVGGVQRLDPLGDWLVGSGQFDALTGPNAHAVLDPDDEVWVQESLEPPYFVESGLDGAEEVPADSQDDWKAPLVSNGPATWDDDAPFSWTTNGPQSATQLFWYVNRFHDHLEQQPISFDAGSGNFEGDDPVIAQAMDGANTSDAEPGLPDPDHVNNASMLTLPDGFPGYMQMHLFGGDFPEVDGANDASFVYHEYAHGLSGRLVTYSDGWEAMWAGAGGGQPGALGEGTSDWYAMDFLVSDGLELDGAAAGDVRVGEYLDGGTNLIRYQGLDCQVGQSPGCPAAGTAGAGGFDLSDYGKIDAGPQVHSDGEIWAQTLWDVRRALIATTPDGVSRARRYITGGLRLAPPQPSFLEMRDAILQSAAIDGSAQDVDTLWQVFANRGMGWSANTTGPVDAQPSAASDRPPGATTGDASAVAPTGASLSAVIDPKGHSTSYRFQYGETANYGAATDLVTVSDPSRVAVVAQTIANLRPATTYHYRVVASRGAREVPGTDRTFTTPATSPPTPTPAPTVTPTPMPGPTPSLRPTVLMDTSLSASRKGIFKLRVFFGDAVPAGDARFTVMNRKRKRFARATTPVRAGGTVIKTLRLNTLGRSAIRRGKSKTVTLELRLPSGQKYKKTLRLSRRKR
jgi:extracellular elastinolytic metalloproteinase